MHRNPSIRAYTRLLLTLARVDKYSVSVSAMLGFS